MLIFKKLAQYLTEDINITMVPSPKQKIRSLSIRRIIPIIIIVLILGVTISLSLLYCYYYSNYHTLNNKIVELKELRVENEKLKNELYVLTQDTELLRNELTHLKDKNYEIKNMIEAEENEKVEGDDNLKLERGTILSESNNFFVQGLPVGGGRLSPYYYNPEKMINRAKENIHKIKEEIPTQEDDLHSLESSAIEYNNLKAATPKIWPLGDNGDAYISSNFGWRKDPFTGQQQIHEGIDIATWYNTPVVSTADGKVVFAGWEGGYGRLVVIEHGYGFKTKYAHLNEIFVKEGQTVERGETVAFSGNSGRSQGPHLHYEVLKNSIPQDPRSYIGR